MSWYGAQGDWPSLAVPASACDLHHLVRGMLGSDAPTGPMSIVMASIIRYCNLKVVVELGVYHGGTTVFLADACRDTGGRVLGVDAGYCLEARTRIHMEKLDSYVTWHHGCTWDFKYHGPPIDFLFIDAGHAVDDISKDWLTWSGHVKPGGWIFIDNSSSEIGVRMFLDMLVRGAVEPFTKRYQYINCPESFGMFMCRKKKPTGDAIAYIDRM